MDTAPRPGPTSRARIRVVSGSGVHDRRDDLATEEPMEIRLAAGGVSRTVAITMRTPTHDFELAAGFLHGEGVIKPGEIASIAYCTDEDVPPEARHNTVTVRLHGSHLPELPSLSRNFVTTSACGVCGTGSLDALRRRLPHSPQTDLTIPAETLLRLPELLRARQGIFGKTGGLHAAGLFTRDGTLTAVREDVGRHNAVDKLIGAAVLAGHLPLHDHILMVSGRASYDIMQKAVTAGIPVVCAVSAPSSLAVDLAREFRVTLVGFLRETRFNIYTEPDRVVVAQN
ncbi:formate dehydrogenase accessory sulfurtransferase FdhD [Rhizohabitans arisaemae]|uniref:formate dehydrogenase accessory sulfurtransferase FdhD n=1 Tax=Rhizohabitans arisaemae TaxID=2720610 RepID=UPI0024B20CAD|nr:formate dehydrogenase accessory sulfurtransferase FdhD [Rhizohabitans arisaemae]